MLGCLLTTSTTRAQSLGPISASRLQRQDLSHAFLLAVPQRIEEVRIDLGVVVAGMHCERVVALAVNVVVELAGQEADAFAAVGGGILAGRDVIFAEAGDIIVPRMRR